MKKRDEVIKYLLENNITISSVESVTGGLFSSTLVSYPSISKIYKGSLVTYNLDIKKKLLKIKDDEIEGVDVVSSNMALLMVDKGYKIFKTDIVISFTGNAGPSLDSDSKILKSSFKGVAYFIIKYKDNVYPYRVYYPKLERNQFRKRLVNTSFSKLYEILLKNRG